jgi:hypothetical protein
MANRPEVKVGQVWVDLDRNLTSERRVRVIAASHTAGSWLCENTQYPHRNSNIKTTTLHAKWRLTEPERGT